MGEATYRQEKNYISQHKPAYKNINMASSLRINSWPPSAIPAIDCNDALSSLLLYQGCASTTTTLPENCPTFGVPTVPNSEVSFTRVFPGPASTVNPSDSSLPPA